MWGALILLDYPQQLKAIKSKKKSPPLLFSINFAIRKGEGGYVLDYIS